MEKKSIKINISGIDYSLKSDEDVEYVETIARFVEERLEKIGKTTKVNSQTKIAVLAALNITADLFKLNKLHKETVKKLETYETRSKELSDSVDRYLTQYQESRH